MKYRIQPGVEMWRSNATHWNMLVAEQWQSFVSDKWVTYDETDLTDGLEPATYYYFRLPCFQGDVEGMYTGTEPGPAYPWTRLRVLKYLVGGPYEI